MLLVYNEPAKGSFSTAHLPASVAGGGSASTQLTHRVFGNFGAPHRSATHRRFPRSRPRQRVNPGDSHVVDNCGYVGSLPVFVPRPREGSTRRLGLPAGREHRRNQNGGPNRTRSNL